MEMKINNLPAKTWRWLHMNETAVSEEADLAASGIAVNCPASVSQNNAQSQELKDTETGMGSDMTRLLAASQSKVTAFATQEGVCEKQPLVLSFGYQDGDRKGDVVELRLAKDSELTVLMDYVSGEGSGTAAVQTVIRAEENAKLHLVQVERLGSGYTCMNDIGAFCEANAGVDLVQLVLGGKDVRMGCLADLSGKASDLQVSIGYQVQGSNTLDMNYAAIHKGKKTTSHIDASGVLRGEAKKLFRGTIDFKKGAKGAKGDELEDVLLLDDGVQNQTIPLILCAEEDVEGNHGASIGNLDEEMMFYLASRGISEEAAYELVANAKLKAVCGKIPDQKLREELEAYLDGDDDTEGREEL